MASVNSASVNSVSVDSASVDSASVSTAIDPSVLATLTISIPTKTGKKCSILIDGLRILAWENFRSEYKEQLKDLEYGGYQLFDNLWKEHEIHSFSYSEVVAYAKTLEFNEAELINLRNNYYAKKAKSNPTNSGNRSYNNSNGNGNGNGDGNSNSNDPNYDGNPGYSSQEYDPMPF